MKLRQLVPWPSVEIDADTLDGRETLSGLYAAPQRRWLRINLVASVNGQAAGADGTSESLTNRVDRRILGILRRLADIVLVGAASVRTEGYFLPKSAPLAIVTRSGDLSGHRIPRDVPAGKVIVLCPSASAATVRATLGIENAAIIELDTASGRASVNLAEATHSLRALGHEGIVCEGGPNLASQLLNAGLVDELCLSTSPQVSATDTRVLPGLAANLPLRLEHLLSDSEGYLFARWAVLS